MTSEKVAEDTKNTSIINNIAKLLYEQKNNSRFSWHNKLLLSAQNKKAIALFDAGSSPIDMRVTTQTEFCSRLENRIPIYNWRDYLETLSSLPVEFWTSEIAEEYLKISVSCKKTRKFY